MRRLGLKKLALVSLVIVETSFAGSVPSQSQIPVQSSSIPQTMSPQSQSLPTAQVSTPSQSNSALSNSMPPVEIKPEDRAIINLKKKMTVKQTYNDYQKVDKATSIDRLNLERSLREAKYALKVQLYKEKQFDSQLPYPYYYDIPIVGVVGDIALTSSTPLKDGTVLRGKDRISIRDGLVYIGDYLVSYPVMDSIKQPKIDTNLSFSSAPQLLTGLPASGPSGAVSSVVSPSVPLPPLPPLPMSK